MELRKELLDYVDEELKILQTGSLHELEPLLAIDGEAFISEILQDDFYSQVLGGTNFTLKTHLSYHIRKLKEWQITPVFFFNGISLRPETAIIAKKCKKSKRLWEEFSKGNTVEIEKLLVKQDVLSLENYREILEIIRNEGGEVMKCPGHCGFQISYLDKVVRGVVGGLDLACFGITKIITSLEYETGIYKSVNVNQMLKIMEITSKKYMECLVARGFWLGKKFIKMSAVEFLQGLKAKDLKNIIGDDGKCQQIENACSVIDSQFYLCSDQTKVNFKTNSTISSMMPARCAEKFYCAMCLIGFSSDLLTSYIKKVEVMTPPISDSLKYRTLVHKYKPLMRKIYSIMNRNFDENQPLSLKGVKVYYWYDEIQPFQLDFELVKEINWDPFLEYLLDENKVCKIPNIDLQSCASAHIDMWRNQRQITDELKKPSENKMEFTKDLLKVKMHLRVLENLGFISPQGFPTLFGRVITLAKTEFQNEIFLVLELLKLGLLDWKPMNSIYLPENVLKKISPDSSDYIRIISRVSCFIQPSLNGELWTAPVDHDLAQFYSLLRHIVKTVQYLAEVYLLEDFINGRIEINRETITSLLSYAHILPLKNVAVGIQVKKLLEGKSVQDLKKEIPQILDIEGDLEKAWIFWKEVQSVIKIVTTDNDSVRNIIEEASKLFKTSLLNAGIHVI